MANTQEELKQLAAKQAAACELRSGMILGLGTGSTTRYFVDIVGERIKNGESYRCVASSIATEQQAKALSIPLISLDEAQELDLTVDGTDEFDPHLNLIKGGGGALLREKMLALSSRRLVVIADFSKKVDMLGRFPLPIEIIPFAQQTTIRAFKKAFLAENITLTPRLRLKKDGTVFITDNGNLIVDCINNGIPNPGTLAARLDTITGIVEHGLFVSLCACVYAAHEEGVAVFPQKA